MEPAADGRPQPVRDTAKAADYQYLIDYTLKLWPALRDVAWTHFWNGQLAISTDHYPHFHEPAPGALAVLAYNGRGVAMATAMARRWLRGSSGRRRMNCRCRLRI